MYHCLIHFTYVVRISRLANGLPINSDLLLLVQICIFFLVLTYTIHLVSICSIYYYKLTIPNINVMRRLIYPLLFILKTNCRSKLIMPGNILDVHPPIQAQVSKLCSSKNPWCRFKYCQNCSCKLLDWVEITFK